MVKVTLFLFIFLVLNLYSQSEDWEVYIAQYDDGPGSVSLNMNLFNYAPIKEMPFIVIVNVTVDNCNENGFPNNSDLLSLNKIADSVKAAIATVTQNRFAGSYTGQCERINYIYVKDSTKIRTSLKKLFFNRFSQKEYNIRIKEDKEWRAYLTFLYPNDFIKEDMTNRKIISKLINAGDDLTKKRKVEHWIYFKTKADLNRFAKYIKGKKFKIEFIKKIDNGIFPFQVTISRFDNIQLKYINQLTFELRKMANKANGKYDGWETLVITK